MKLFRKDRWRLLSFLITMTVTLFLATYNAILGINYHVFFNVFGSLYYSILLVIRIVLFIEEYQWMKKGIMMKKSKFIFTSIFMIYLTAAITLIVSVMAYLQNQVKISNTPSIILGALAAFKILSLVKRYFEFRKDKNLFNRQTMNVTMISAGVTLLMLLNTLIATNGGFDGFMTALFIMTGVSLVFLMEAETIISFLKGLKSYRNTDIQ